MTDNRFSLLDRSAPGSIVQVPHDPSPAFTTLSAADQFTAAARYRRLLMVLPGGIVVLDGEGLVQECNPAAADLLGSPLLGAAWRDVVKRSFEPRSDDGHDISLRGGRRVNISTQALDGEAGQILLITDVSETRRLQDEVGRHKRLAAMGEMAASLAHQIRTPLSAAILYLSNLATNRALDSATRQRFSEKSLARLRHLEQLVNHMLLYARAGTFDMEEVSLQELLDELQRQNDQRLRSGELVLNVRSELQDVVLRANRAALLSVLHNLVDNAVQAVDGCCRLGIEAYLDANAELCLDFADNGSGVPAELRDNIFEPFITTRAQGNGLGLAVAQAVLRAHHGSISLETVAPQGALFRIRLPVLVDGQQARSMRSAVAIRHRA